MNASALTPILMYHSVSRLSADRRFSKFITCPDAFSEQMKFLSEEGFRVFDLATFGRTRHEIVDRTVVLTFDDAYDDFDQVAAPLLKHMGFGASLFVPTAFVGGAPRWLGTKAPEGLRVCNAASLRKWAEAGFDIGAHSHSHPQLDMVRRAVAAQEIGTRSRHSPSLLVITPPACATWSQRKASNSRAASANCHACPATTRCCSRD
jgi:peptidoglycan/xylan/chitin deacetylase (PgdA/CDA1 family)